MKVSLRWLAEYLPDLNRSVEEIVDALTFTGVEVEAVERRGGQYPKVVVAQIKSFRPHPDADRLSICQVSDGTAMDRQIVCGAKNFKALDKVALALPGAVLPGGLKIKSSKLRGVASEGMLCSAKELELAEDAAGLLILPPDTPVGAPLADLFPGDTVLDLEITPDRPDLLSYRGIARELAVIFEVTGPEDLAPVKTGAVKDPSRVRITALEQCPFIAFQEVRDVKIGPSPAWLSARLSAAGIRPINNIVDITNYVMLETGKPLHAYDLAHLEGGIEVRMAQSGEELVALDGKKYSLHSSHLVIADQRRVIGLAGVMGGESTGVTDRTSTILLESAYFVPATVRSMSRGLGLISDASFRFERGVDPASVLPSLARAVDLVLEIAGGKAADTIAVAGEPPAPAKPVLFRQERCDALLGVAVPNTPELLQRIGLKPVNKNEWQVPSYRPDLRQEVDLIEEVCRYHGIQKIPGRISGQATPSSPVDYDHDSTLQLRRRLAGLGLLEARSLVLVDDKALEESLSTSADVFRLRNPLAEDQKILRPSLLSGLLRSAERNFNRGQNSVALFEIGHVFHPGRQEEEPTHVAIVLAGDNAAPSWNQRPRPFDLFDLKAFAREVIGCPIQLRRVEPNRLAALICEVIGPDGSALGRLGQLRPARARDFGSRSPVFVAELKLATEERFQPFQLRPLDRFPAVTRDVAFLAERELKFARVLGTLRSAAEPLLADIQLFDLFVDPSGEKIPKDRKSLACSLTYRATDRTLTQDEVNTAHQRLKLLLVERLRVTLRES
jgi:phenylalanyl-tRNA synthetase beta chain